MWTLEKWYRWISSQSRKRERNAKKHKDTKRGKRRQEELGPTYIHHYV